MRIPVTAKPKHKYEEPVYERVSVFIVLGYKVREKFETEVSEYNFSYFNFIYLPSSTIQLLPRFLDNRFRLSYFYFAQNMKMTEG